MADFPGKLNKMNDYPGVGNTFTFTLNPDIPNCQLVAQGFNLSTTTVTVLAVGDSTEPDTVPMTNMNKTCSISDTIGAIRMRSITIGGMTTGKIGVYQ